MIGPDVDHALNNTNFRSLNRTLQYIGRVHTDTFKRRVYRSRTVRVGLPVYTPQTIKTQTDNVNDGIEISLVPCTVRWQHQSSNIVYSDVPTSYYEINVIHNVKGRFDPVRESKPRPAIC